MCAPVKRLFETVVCTDPRNKCCLCSAHNEFAQNQRTLACIVCVANTPQHHGPASEVDPEEGIAVFLRLLVDRDTCK